MSKTTVLVVDDVETTRQSLVKILSISPFIQVGGTAINGNDAIRKVNALAPDVITLDLEMPEMDGFTFLRWLMKNRPTPVLIISSNKSNRIVFQALELGAVDFLVKPASMEEADTLEFRKLLISRIKKISQLSPNTIASRVNLFSEAVATVEKPAERRRLIDCIVIGASTGGPPAIHHIVNSLPEDFQVPIVIIQHMPKGFTKPFAERLARNTNLPVIEAQDGSTLKDGHIIIAPGGYHLVPERKSSHSHVYLLLSNRSKNDKYVPSIDRFMIAASSLFGSRLMGILLTGMGNDGVKGLAAIYHSSGITIAESQETAIVYGMPKEAINNKIVRYVSSLNEIPKRIQEFCW